MRIAESLFAVGVLLVGVGGLACSRDEKRTVDDARTSSSSEPRPKRPTSDWPIVEVDASDIRLDGKTVGSSRAVSDRGQMQKIDELFVSLKARREKFKEESPGKEFPGVCGIRIDESVPMIVFKSVFQTAAYAGYPYISVQPMDDSDAIVTLNAQIPGPPRAETAPSAAPDQQLHVYLTEAEVTLTRKQGATVVDETKTERDPKDVLRAVSEDWKKWGQHTDKTDARLDEAVFHADNGLAIKDALPFIAAIRGCTRELEGQPKPVPAFSIAMSVR